MAITKASESLYRRYDVITTGLPALDRVLGIGGIPTRKITEISGLYSVGKSTLAFTIVKQFQSEGREVLWADTEYSFDEKYAISLGVNCDTLDLLQERLAEDTLDSIENWAESHKNGLIVLDSIGHLLPRAEAEKTADGRVIGGQAKLVATFCRKILPIIAINNHALVVLNHQFTDIMSGKIKTSGGAKLEYAKSIWIALRKPGKVLKKGEQAIGDIIEVDVRKNKLADTMRQKAELSLFYGKGFSAEADRLKELIESGEIIKKGRLYFRGETRIASSAEEAREYVSKL